MLSPIEQPDGSMKIVKEEFKDEVINLQEGINGDNRKHVEAQNPLIVLKSPWVN